MWQSRIYLDYAGATPVSPAAHAAFSAALKTWANPSALYAEGVAAHELLTDARRKIARVLECKEGEVVFTSGGTEGNNMAILGVAQAHLEKRSMSALHIITTTIEHASVLEPIRILEKAGARVTWIVPDPLGRISVNAITQALTPSTILVSVGWANSEIGTVQPIGAIAKAIRAYEAERGAPVVFHSDAGQAPLYLSPIIAGLGVDVLTVDAGKVYGMRGAGALYVRKGTALKSLFHGGEQERGLRPGTENVALAQALATALMEATAERTQEVERLRALRSTCVTLLTEAFPESVVNGGGDKILPHIVNVSIPTIDPEYIVLALDAAGIAVATKSACEEGRQDSHVVRALVGPENIWRARTTLRFSFGHATREKDIVRMVAALKTAVAAYQKVAIDKL